jgi:SRSO17 transposase
VEIGFQTKPQIGLDQIRQALKESVPEGVVVADAGYGNDSGFRWEITKLGWRYVLGVQSATSVWELGKQPLPAKRRKRMGRPPRRLRRSAQHQPLSVRDLAFTLPPSVWHDLRGRQGTERTLRSRFAAVRVRPAHRDDEEAEAAAEEWLLMEWPKADAEPIKYWLSTLPAGTKLKDLVKMAKHRWVIERDYRELKQELGLNHYQGRGWRGFHHHATLCIAAYGFLIAERNRFSPSARAGHAGLSAPQPPPGFHPRGSPPSSRAA